ncbi:hypothetical protein [Streptomyces sp. NPDC020298]|uniref:hypothetical protein n=1 Tax=unclassified Streptomyces TaxID=2593676 RepID=UPI0033E9888F
MADPPRTYGEEALHQRQEHGAGPPRMGSGASAAVVRHLGWCLDSVLRYARTAHRHPA